MGLSEGKIELIVKVGVVLIILAFIGGMFLGKAKLCGDSPQADTTYIYDTAFYEIPVEIPVADTIYIGKPYPVEVINYDTILETDTVFIMADYSAERVYYDTIQDAKLTAYLHERIQFNRITHREFGYKITAPTAQITRVNNYLHGGLLIYYTGDDAGFAPMVNYTNERFTAGVGYDFIRRGIFVQSGLTLLKW
jgi:hypothetical protein